MNAFEGTPSLNTEAQKTADKPKGPKEPTAMQKYLEAKYGPKKPKKKKSRGLTKTEKLKIIDEDLTGFAPVQEDIEVKEIDPDGPAVLDESETRVLKEMERKKSGADRKGTWTSVKPEADGDDAATARCPPYQSSHPDQSKDMSPPRRSGVDEDLSPLRRRTTDEDLSPPRRSHQDEDMSPPRRPRSDEDLSPPRRGPELSRKRQKKRMLDGTATGIISGDQLKEDLRKKRRQDKEKLLRMGDELTGKGAETVYRNRDGQRVSLEELQKERSKEKKKVKWEKVEWDSGLAQQRDAKRLKAEYEREITKPFGRSRDEDLDAMYRARDRWGDPMSSQNKRQKSNSSKPVLDLSPVIDETNRHWFEKNGFVVPQEIPDHSWIKRGVAPLSNRFNIKPGRHWDGVDRSNGFEREHAKYLNECTARDREAAAWCMEDM